MLNITKLQKSAESALAEAFSEKCKSIKRKGRVMVICENPKHKQKQG